MHIQNLSMPLIMKLFLTAPTKKVSVQEKKTALHFGIMIFWLGGDLYRENLKMDQISWITIH